MHQSITLKRETQPYNSPQVHFKNGQKYIQQGQRRPQKSKVIMKLINKMSRPWKRIMLFYRSNQEEF